MPEPRLPTMPLTRGRPEAPKRMLQPQPVFPLFQALLACLLHGLSKLRAPDASLEQAAP